MRGSLWLPPTGGDVFELLNDGVPEQWAFEALGARVKVERADEDDVRIEATPVYETPADDDEHDVGPVWLYLTRAGALELAGDLARAATAKWVLFPPPSPEEVAAELRELARGGRGAGRVVPRERLEHLAWALEAGAQ